MRASSRPIITLTTDFGLSDYYVAAMKAVLLRGCPQAQLVDVSHQVPRQDILCGSIVLERAIDSFPPGTVHLAVIDPGVGTGRRILIARIARQLIVCPDNGMITWAWRMHGRRTPRAFELTWRPPRTSSTFHGRDIMAPVAARLAAGAKFSTFARIIADPILLHVAPASSPAGQIIHIDHYGNATTNLPESIVQAASPQRVRAGRRLVPMRRTYADVAVGKPLALIGSSGLLEIAVRNGHAARSLGLKVGDKVSLA